MNRRRGWTAAGLTVALVFGLCGLSGAQELSQGQQMLLAKRAAQADAYRQLAEEIKGLRIDANTYVRDFVAESDQISTSLDAFIKGLKVAAPPRYLPDGSAEVDVKVTLVQVMQGLQKIQHKYASGRQIDFSRMVKYNEKKILTATGHGVPRPSGPQVGTPPLTVTAVNPVAGIPGWENVTTQGRLLAERGALTDARRNLAETVKGLRITSNTYVKDFVVESDQISTELHAFMKGIKAVGPYRFLPGGICEVTVEVTIQDVIKKLTTIRQRMVTAGYPWPNEIWRTVKFEKIVDWGPPKTIRATGNAAVPKRGYREGGGVTSSPFSAGPGLPAWASETLRATGTGIPREGETGMAARLGAERAAEVEARRNLAEQVYGVQIDSTTTVRDFVTERDEVKASVAQVIGGSQIVGEPRFLEDGSVEVTVELPLKRLWETIQ